MPPSLDDRLDALWNLQELVDEANALLPAYLPKGASGRSSDEVNPRLVRHYTTLGLLPEPLKEGREARYVFDHLLHLLVVRRLLAEGFSSTAIAKVLAGRTPDERRRLLDGGVRVELVPEPATERDPRREFLRALRQEAGLDPVAAPADSITVNAFRPSMSAEPSRDAPARTPNQADLFREIPWARIELLDGLELHVRSDFAFPTHRLGDDEIAQLVKVVLLNLEQTRKAKS